MMLDRLEGNEALKEEVSRMLSGRRLSHSLLLIGEQGLGAGFAARCIAADYLYPAGGPAAEALPESARPLRSEFPAEPLLHLAAHLADAPAEEQQPRHDQQQKSHKEIKYEKRDALQQRRSAYGQHDDQEHGQRIALHEPREGIDYFG